MFRHCQTWFTCLLRSPGHHDPGHGDGAVPHVEGVAHLALRHVLRAALQPALGYRVSTESVLNIISWTNLQLVRHEGGEQHEQGGEGQCKETMSPPWGQCGMHGHHWALFSTIYHQC